MPVIIPEQHHATWLGETHDGNLKALLLPYPADQMRMWEISPRVYSPKNDDPSLWEPLHLRTCETAELPRSDQLMKIATGKETRPRSWTRLLRGVR